MISSQTLALPEDPPARELPMSDLGDYVGTYEAGAGYSVRIETVGAGLVSATNGAKPTPLLVEARDALFTPGQPRIRRVFERDATGKVVGFDSRRDSHTVVHLKRES